MEEGCEIGIDISSLNTFEGIRQPPFTVMGEVWFYLCIVAYISSKIIFKNLVCYTFSRTQLYLVVQWEYNYMFRPYMSAIFRLQSNFSGGVIQDVWGVFRALGVGWGEGKARSRLFQ